MDVDIPDIDEILITPKKCPTHAFSREPTVYSPKELRRYQKDVCEKYRDWRHNPEYAGNNSISEREAVIAISMGMGKTVIAAEAIKDEITHGGQVLWVTHRRELKTQCKNAIMQQTGIPAAYSVHQLNDEKVLITGNTIREKTLGKMQKLFEPTLIIIDEAHHAYADTYRAIKQQYPKAKVLNLTATPYRADITDELELGTKLAAINPSEAIEMGYLTPFKTVAKLTHDFSRVKMDGKDYNATSLSKIMMSDEMLDASTKAVMEKCEGRRGLVYCCNKKHANLMRNSLESAGLRVKIVTEDVPMPEREKIYQLLADGEIDQVMNVNCLTEGFDLPPVDMISILRPTKNAALYVQMLGRGLRLSPETGKTECIVIDALDVSKTKGRKETFDLPLEEEVMRYRATIGKPVAAAALFLSWFDGGAELPVLDSPDSLNSVINNGAALNERNRKFLEKIWDSDSLTETDLGGYAAMSMGVGCSGVEHVRKVLVSKGYRFNPHGVEKPLVIEDAGGGRRVDKRVKLGNAKSEKTPLKNLVIDLLEPNVDVHMPLEKFSTKEMVECISRPKKSETDPMALALKADKASEIKPIRWFKDMGTGLDYAWCISQPGARTKGALVERCFAVRSPKGRPLWFKSDPLLMLKQDGIPRFRPEGERRQCQTKNGEDVSLGSFFPMRPEYWDELSPATQDQAWALSNRCTKKQRERMIKDLKLTRTQRANLRVNNNVTVAMSSYLLDQNGIDTREILKHIQPRVDVIDVLWDLQDLNLRLPLLNPAKLKSSDDPVEIARGMKVKASGIVPTELVDPARSVMFGDKLYYLNLDKDKFCYKTDTGEVLRS